MSRSLAALVALVVAFGTTAASGVQVAPGDGVRPTTTPRASSGITSVLAISVDGLTPRALRRLGRKGAPNFHEFRRAGASTMNARTLDELTLTLPNHTGMVTGRRVTAREGGHGVTWNDDRRRPRTVQSAAQRRVPSIFSSIQDSGGTSALFAAKTKFSLWNRSWPRAVQRQVISADNSAVVDSLVRDLVRTPRTFRFLHISLPDTAGHESGFMTRPYLRAVKQSDQLLGRVVEAVVDSEQLRDSTAIILTSDHGGGPGRRHYDPTSPRNFRVPFMVRGPGVTPGADLYRLNPDYRDPRSKRVPYSYKRQPVRNGALANLALDLLGLPPVPGSEHNRRQDLDVSPTS